MMRLEVPPAPAPSAPTETDRIRTLVERMRKAMTIAARPNSGTCDIQDSINAQREFYVAIEALLAPKVLNTRMATRIAECVAVLRPRVAKSWPGEQALGELSEYALLSAGLAPKINGEKVSA